jgi:hypothetical protein
MKHYLGFILFLLLLTGITFTQDDIGSSPSTNQPSVFEQGKETYFERGAFYPLELEAQHKAALESGNLEEAKRLENKMNSMTPDEYKINSFDNNPNVEVPTEVGTNQPPYNPDWYGTDVSLYSGAIKFGNPYFRQIDMKMGEDGNMYVAVNRAPATGVNGRIDVYTSSNGGATWVYTNGIQYTTSYIGTVSMLVEVRGTVPDSARIFVFYTVSSTANNDGAVLAYGSWRRNGTAWYTGNIGTPPAGQEYSFASAISDGYFWTTATYIGVMCTQSDNALTTTNNFRYYRSVNWGQSWTGVTISSGFNDFYPSADYRPGSPDSVWIAVERRLSATQYEVRVIRTPFSPVASSNTYFVTSGGANVRYEKPALAIKQNSPTDTSIITSTKNGVSYYLPTTNGGGSWSVDFTLGGTANGNNKAFTWCNTSSRGTNSIIAMWVSNDGDSINIRRGVINFLGTTAYKRNSNTASTSVSPTCMIYSPNATTNLSAFSYAGFGPTNIYANQEGLVTGISQNGTEVPNDFSLSQNYPNPFNPVTNIKFAIPVSGFVKLTVFDITGREVAVIVNKEMTAGNYTADLDASKLSSGVYFYKLNAGDFSDTKKMMLVK